MLLQEVDVSSANAPYEVLATTNQHGDFAIQQVCEGETLLFVKSGYVPQTNTVVSTSIAMQVNLQLIGECVTIVWAVRSMG